MTQKALSLPAEDDGEASVKTIDRAARLLRAVATHGDGAMLSAVARETGLGKGTVHRLLNALVDAGFVFQDQETRRYRLGAGLALLGQAAHRQDLATEDTIFASLREGGTAVCVAREIGAFPIRTLSLNAGDVRPLGVGSGSLALLAFQRDDEIDTILERNTAWYARYPGHTRKAILSDIAETRRRGHSFVDGKIVPGMNAIGVPVLNAEGRAVAALSLAAIADRISGARIAELVALLTREAAVLAEAMGLPTPAAQAPSRRARAT
jgi:DNA-binding IclR family transcriptional regulator